MRYIAPDFYPNFRCIAAACRHSCCCGWEIDIDDESLRRYACVPGELGALLKQSIALEPTPHFVLDAHERCPLLREDGLCRIILGLGDDALCDICAEHPRFYNDYPGRFEMGLGLCCEEATRLFLAVDAPLSLIEQDDSLEDEDSVPLTPLLALRERVFACLRGGGSLRARFAGALALLDSPPIVFTPQRLGALLLPLERMDEAWTAMLTRLATAPACPDEALNALRYERIGEYMIYRHFANAADLADAAARLRFAQLAAETVASLDLLGFGDEALRLFSAEVEYSDDNMASLLAQLAEKKTANSRSTG